MSLDSQRWNILSFLDMFVNLPVSIGNHQRLYLNLYNNNISYIDIWKKSDLRLPTVCSTVYYVDADDYCKFHSSLYFSILKF